MSHIDVGMLAVASPAEAGQPLLVKELLALHDFASWCVGLAESLS